MNKLKRWIVHKLGGKFYSEFVKDLPIEMQQELMRINVESYNKVMNDYLDKQAFEIFKNGFSTEYTKNELQ